ncbi:MAG: hypothetical protein SOI41_07285 [Heyndrickxia coagulans]|jgi:hypothetical protein
MTTFSGTINSTGRITAEQSKKLATYTKVGWQPTKWTTNGDTTLPQLIVDGYEILTGLTINSTGRITADQAKQQSTYENAGWDFINTWEMEDYPVLKTPST